MVHTSDEQHWELEALDSVHRRDADVVGLWEVLLKLLGFDASRPERRLVLTVDLVVEAGRTRSTWTTSLVGTSAAGNASVEAFTQDAHDHMRARLGVELQHYLATGELISAEELERSWTRRATETAGASSRNAGHYRALPRGGRMRPVSGVVAAIRASLAPTPPVSVRRSAAGDISCRPAAGVSRSDRPDRPRWSRSPVARQGAVQSAVALG